MAIYARPSWRLARQVVADVFVLVWAAVWWSVSRTVKAAVDAVADPARDMVDALSGLEQDMTDAANGAGGVPMIGDRLRVPFDSAAAGVAGLGGDAQAQINAVENLAAVCGWCVFGIPVLVVLIIWSPARIRFVLRATAARRALATGADVDLFALRALATQPLARLHRIDADPLAAWRAGDREVVRALADLELRRCGVSLPAGDPAGQRLST